MPRAEAWVAVRAASRARAGRQRRGRRRRKEAVARRVRRGPRGLARWVVVQARRALAQEREAAWEREAARPTGCWRAAESRAQSAVEGRWADRLRLPWRRRRLVRQCRRRPSAPTGCLQSLCLRLTVTTGASWGCLCPANPKAHRRPGLARLAHLGAGPAGAAGAGPAGAAGAGRQPGTLSCRRCRHTAPELSAAGLVSTAGLTTGVRRLIRNPWHRPGARYRRSGRTGTGRGGRTGRLEPLPSQQALYRTSGLTKY